MPISFRIRRSCQQPAWDSYLESSAAPTPRPAVARSLAQEFGDAVHLSGAWTQEFPHALPFRQYLQHGWTASFAFPFLDDGVSSSDGEGRALVARRASAKLSLPPEQGARWPVWWRTRIPALSLRQSPIPRM